MSYVRLPGSPNLGTSSNDNGADSSGGRRGPASSLPSTFVDLTSRRKPRPLILLIVIASAGLLVILGCFSAGVDTADLSQHLQTKLSHHFSRPSFLSSSPTSQLAAFRSWDYYSKYGSLQLDRKNKRLPQHQRARFVPVEIESQIVIEQESLRGAKSSSKNRVNVLDESVLLEDGFDELVKYSKASEWGIEFSKRGWRVR